MKIIKPMDGIEDKYSNDAPPDEFQQWEPEGRFNRFQSVRVSVGGNRAFSLPDTSGNNVVSAYDLSTGAQSFAFSDSSTDGITIISASPDGKFLAYACYTDNGEIDWTLKVYDTTSSQIVFSRDSQSGLGIQVISWAPDSSGLMYLEQSFLQGFLGCVKVDASTWAASVFAGNLIDEANFNQTEQIYANNKAAALAASGECFVSFRASAYASSEKSTVVCRLSQALSLTHSKLLDASIYPQGILANDARSEVAIIHGGTGASFFDYADLTPIGTPGTLSGTSYKGLSVSQDGAEFTLQASSVQPYNRTFSLTDYSAVTAMPAEGDYARICYGADYFLGINSDGSYDIVDLATNALITQTNPNVTAGDIYTYQDRNYEALTSNNDRPDLGAIADPPTWLDMGVVNPLRMFDGKLDSRTTAPDVLTITVNPGVIANGLALFNVSAQSVQVTVDDPVDGLVYDSGDIAMLDNSAVSNWWEFFYSPYVAKADLALTDLSPYPDAEITITISNPGDVAAIGEMVLGRIQSIGEIQYGTNVGIIDSSTKERDVFGNFEIIERKFSKRAEFDVSMTTGSVSGVQRILAGYRASPVVWIGEIDYEATIVYGFYRDFQINFSHYSLSDATITVEGL